MRADGQIKPSRRNHVVSFGEVRKMSPSIEASPAGVSPQDH